MNWKSNFRVGNRVKVVNDNDVCSLYWNNEHLVTDVRFNHAGNQDIRLENEEKRWYSASRFELVKDSNTNTETINKSSNLTFEDRFLQEMTKFVMEMLDYEGVSDPNDLPDLSEWNSLVMMCRNLGYDLEIDTNPNVLLSKI